MSEEKKKEHKSSYITDLYAGTTLTPDSILNVLTSDHPTNTVKTKIITDPASVCKEVTCEAPWIERSSSDGSKYCVQKLGKTTGKNDLCDGIPGAQTIYFVNDNKQFLDNVGLGAEIGHLFGG